ncbi:MAG: tRNA lysidine(34) synthetase TilS [Moorellaceae bacterium]
MESVLDRVRQTIDRYGLLTKGDTVVVGVSGGPDSLALLHCLLLLREEYGVDLHVAHLNHLLREEAAAREAAFVRELAAGWGLPVTVAARDVRAYQRKRKLSLEEAAREVRYRFLYEVAEKVGAGKIAVGHQADDQAETVLLNLLRGSGLTGLKAMVPRRDRIIRPLLFVTRAEIESYCREKGLTPCWDLSNLDTAYRRNKIRHELLPLLAREYNPGIVLALARTAAILAEENELLEEIAGKALAQITLEQGRGFIKIDGKGFSALGAAVQRRVLRQVVLRLGGGAGFEHIETLRVMISTGAGSLTLPGGLKVQVEEEEARFARVGEEETWAPVFSYPLRVPGITLLPEISRRIRAELAPPPENPVCPPYEAWLDRDRLQGALVVRNWLPGDRFRPLGMKGTKKLQDLFVDAGIPAAERRRLPVVLCGENIVWVAGVRMAEEFKITPSTREALHLVLEALEP